MYGVEQSTSQDFSTAKHKNRTCGVITLHLNENFVRDKLKTNNFLLLPFIFLLLCL